MIQLLPPVEKPRHEQGPRPCSACMRSRRDKREHWRCDLFNGALCTFLRHETGECEPDGLYWSERR
jgi:hypothetical protein